MELRKNIEHKIAAKRDSNLERQSFVLWGSYLAILHRLDYYICLFSVKLSIARSERIFSFVQTLNQL